MSNELQQWEEIRTLGLYQPFASAMLHGKDETRWVTVGRKPPFRLGKYLLYSTQKEYQPSDLFSICGPEILYTLTEALNGEPTRKLRGYALAVGNLVSVRKMENKDEAKAFVKFVGLTDFYDKSRFIATKCQYVLIFENILRIAPFKFKGKQGVGILPKDQHHLIKPAPKTQPQ